MQPPFFCDYGSNIELGERVFFNFNCVVLDVCLVKIGSFTLFGPGVQIYTPIAPIQCRAAAATGVRETHRDRIGRLGWRRRDHATGRAYRIERRHRRWQRGNAGGSPGSVCRRPSVPRHSRNYRVASPFICARIGSYDS
jgi:acetyltransferase-like isoleucine patch superfamily enzyme